MIKSTTREKNVTIARDAIVKEAKRIEENCLFSSKGHFVASHFWTNFHLWIGIPSVIIAAVAGTLSFAQFTNHHIVSGVLSIVVVVLTAVSTFLNPKERAGTYLSSGNNYESLRCKVRIFWTIECRNENSEQLLTDRLKDLAQERDRLNRDCPQVPKLAYLKAKRGIESGEASFQVDAVSPK